MKVYFFTPAVKVSTLLGAVTAVKLDPAIPTGYAVDPSVEESEAGFPALSFAVIVNVAISPGAYTALSRAAAYE